MKKLLAFTLALVLMLSLSVVAFAGGSPVKKKVTSSDLPSSGTPVTSSSSSAKKDAEVTVIPNAELSAEQKAVVDKALEAVQADGFLPVDSFMVVAAGDGYVIVEATEDATVFVVYENGSIQKTPVKDLEAVGNSRYKVPVSAGVSSVIVAVAK